MDMVAFRCAASAEHDPLDIALERIDSLVDRIMYETGSQNLEAWLTGSNNYRKEINPAYKAQRKDKPMPRWLQDCREHCVVGWGARVTDGNEADDELGISQCTSESGDTVIVTNDKDLLQIPGEHFNPVLNIKRIISPVDGLRNFYFQMIMGDSSDNIFGFDGKARSKVPKFLEPTIAQLMEMTKEWDMYSYVCHLYWDSNIWDNPDDTIEKNLHCLYIQRKNGDRWQEPESAILPTNPA